MVYFIWGLVSENCDSVLEITRLDRSDQDLGDSAGVNADYLKERK